MEKITIFGEADQPSLQQLVQSAEKGDFAVLCADHHLGYSHPIGGAVAYENHISPSGVGFDIACGNKAVMTNLKTKEVDTGRVMDDIQRLISFGIGTRNKLKADHSVIEKIAHASFNPQRKLWQTAKEQLGTVGGGNHYVDIFDDENGNLWVGVHFGSRGFGFKTAMGFLALAQGCDFTERVKEPSVNSPPVIFEVNSSMGLDYIEAMKLAGEYAYAGRDIVVETVLKLLGAKPIYEVHNHHNFAWHEEHFGKKYWVVRKGCTPAFPGQQGFVGANMEDYSVILEGIDSELSKKALYSTVHGAGRVMSRRKAIGKTKWKKGNDGVRRQVVIQPGLIDYKSVVQRLSKKGIELRGGAADEAPEAYKSLQAVLDKHEGTIKILHWLKPVGVAMAGEGDVDPYKD
ncbi:MAG: RtcB family protein [Bacteroidetes bacterium]|nr:RtcB family protein [Bacteroidota bacterium]